MATQEIRDTDWTEFCKRFTELHKGVRLTIEHVQSDGTSRKIARDLPLDRMSLDKDDACSDLLTIVMGEGAGRHLNHVIVEPIHVKLRQPTDGPKALQIDAESGSSMITFASGKLKELLEGFEVNDGSELAKSQ